MSTYDLRAISFLATKILYYNSFQCPTSRLLANKEPVDKAVGRSCGIWTQVSYFNHSCICTAHNNFIGNMMVVRAACDMDPGAEVTIWYKPLILTGTKMTHWRFVCDCPMCKHERATSATVVDKRKELRDQINTMFDGTGTIKMNKVASLLLELDKTYEKPAIEVPKFDLFHPFLGLAAQYESQKKYKEVVE